MEAFKDGRAVFSAGEYQVDVRVGKPWDRVRKPRVFVGGEDKVDFEPAYAATRADQEALGHYPVRGENPETDKLFDRLNRQVIKNKRAVLQQALAAVPEAAELLEGLKFSFSRKAGCSCACSPGFVASGPVKVQGSDGRSFWIEDVFVTRRAAAEEVSA